MAGIRVACRGCGDQISIAKVDPGEDDTIPWHVELPADHYVTAWPHDPGDMLFFRCRTGDGYAVGTPKRESDAVPGSVTQTTWLDYYNRQVKEYYDFDAEWALIKEICPEVEKATPRRTPRARFHPYHGVSATFATLAVFDFVLLDATQSAIIWFALAVMMFYVATRISRRS